MLPREAARIEALRRRLLDLCSSWGYDLVIPPLAEYAEILLLGGEDVDLHSFKMVDQQNGRTLAVHADITPQIARLDAHTLRDNKANALVRLCYADTVLHTRPKVPGASRTPLQLGAELFGCAAPAGDLEIISLMLEALQQSGLSQLHLDLGHMSIYQELVGRVSLSAEEEEALFRAVQHKERGEIAALLASPRKRAPYAALLLELLDCRGDAAVLATARRLLAPLLPEVLGVLEELEWIAAGVAARMPEVQMYFDLVELRGYRYHQGLVFAAYTPGGGQSVANGGRYNGLGAAFGRARPATGFNLDLKYLVRLAPPPPAAESRGAISAPADERDAALWRKVRTLRAQGERVIGTPADSAPDSSCDRRLERDAQGRWTVLRASS